MTDATAPDPVVTEVTVPLDRDGAFRLFTAGIATWWPLETHAVHGDTDMTCVFESGVGGRIHERTPAGEEADWGRVTAWEPPDRVAFTWHPGRDEDSAQQVEVTFEDDDGGTRVRLAHRGWERLGDRAAEVRDGYVTGWGMMLGQRYAAAARAEAGR